MERKNYSIKEEQVKKLEDHYERTGIRMSEVVRQGIDLYFESFKKRLINGTDKD